MKNLLFLAVIFTAALLFSGNTYSQDDCCKEGAACSNEGSACCTNGASGSQVNKEECGKEMTSMNCGHTTGSDVKMDNANINNDCCKEGAACCTEGGACCDKKTSSSGDAQAEMDSLKSESTDVKTEVSTDVKSERSVCPVSGEEFKTGAGKKISYLGKEYEFCCGGCVEEFKTEPIGYTGGVATCPICNHDDGKKEITHNHDGVKYYFCGESCKKEFSENPDKVLEKYSTSK
jgi:YHS domain-containing protein